MVCPKPPYNYYYSRCSSSRDDTAAAAKATSRRHNKCMYGDLVNGLCYTAFTPVYLYMSRKDPAPGSSNIVVAFAFTTVFSWISYLKQSSVASLLALLGMSASIAGMNLYQWPHQDEVVVIPQFLWSLLIVSGNQRLSFPAKVGGGVMALANAVIVAVATPLLQLSDCLPVLLGATAVHVLFHYYSDSQQNNNNNGGDDNKTSSSSSLFSAKGASIVLAGTFAYHMSSEMLSIITQPGYAVEGGYSILTAGFFACVGLAASGAFRAEIESNTLLEQLVAARTKEVTQQANRLLVVEHALQASETAMAITQGPDHRILWSNKALVRITNYHQQEENNNIPMMARLTDILKVSEQQLQQYLSLRSSLSRSSSGGALSQLQQQQQKQQGETTSADPEDLLCMNGACYQVEIEPLPNLETTPPQDHDGQQDPTPHSSSTSTSYLVLLKDMTALRAREAAEKAAEKEALRAQAMHDSMQTLSHELRTPLQGIMGTTSLILGSSSSESSSSDSDGAEEGITKNPKEAIESLSMIMASSRLLLTLINNMLDVRKCNADMMDSFQLSSIHLQKSIQEAMEFCRPAASLSAIQLQHHASNYAGGDVFVESNALRLQQVMVNLVSNAIKHTQPGGRVTIRIQELPLYRATAFLNDSLASSFDSIEETSSSSSSSSSSNSSTSSSSCDTLPLRDHDKVAVVSVSDSGIGIPIEQSRKLFQEFSQLDASDHATDDEKEEAVNRIGSGTAQPTGTGLGLNLCLKFVRRMNGHIWANNNNGENQSGSCFSFYLPLAAAPPESRSLDSCSNTDASSQSTKRVAHQEQSSSTKLGNNNINNTATTMDAGEAAAQYRVLLVDDVAMNRKVVGRMLSRVGVKHVTTAEGGRQALAELSNPSNMAEQHYNLVITDLSMPEMDGTELSRTLLASSSVSIKPIVVGLTAEVSEVVDRECFASGMVHVLHKPVTIDHMKEFFVKLASGSFTGAQGTDKPSLQTPNQDLPVAA